MKPIFFPLLGVLSGTVLAWAGLLIWADFNLSQNDSLWDRNPQAANGFFILWLLLSVAGGFVGLWLNRHFDRKIKKLVQPPIG